MRRLIRKDLKPVYVFAAQEQESGYVGTKTVWAYSHTVQCNVQPAENKLTAEIYGVRVYDMYSLICGLSDALSEGQRVSFGSVEKPTHRIVSVKRYGMHKVLLAEVIS